jgi:hypothetical protein
VKSGKQLELFKLIRLEAWTPKAEWVRDRISLLNTFIRLRGDLHFPLPLWDRVKERGGSV